MRRVVACLAVASVVVTHSLLAHAEEPAKSAAKPEGSFSRVLVTATADLKLGFVQEQGVTHEDMSNAETSEMARAGFGALVGGMPFSESRFTLGARLREETFVWEEAIVPVLSGTALAGVTFGKPRERQFQFILVGVGAEGIPALTPPIFAVHLLGGTSMDGLVLAAGVDVGSIEDFSYILFGVEIGWGRYY